MMNVSHFLRRVTPKKLVQIVVLSTAVCVLSVVFPLQTLAANPQAVKLYNQGIDAYTNGQADQALDLFNRVIALDKNYSDAYYNLGSIYYQKRLYPQSEKAFKQAVTLNPSDEMARFNLGLALEKLNRHQEAVDTYRAIPNTGKKYQQAQEKIKTLQPMIAQQRPSQQNPQVGQPYNNQQPGNNFPNGNLNVQPPPQYTVSTFSKGFYGPTGITIGPGGYLYVANYSKNLIYKVGANGEKQLFSKDQNLNGPMGMAYNPKRDELYVANYLKNTVARVDRNGKVDVVASGLKKPYNLFLDINSGMLYVSEQETSSISRIVLPR